MAETIKIEIPIEVLDNTDPELSKVINALKNMEKASDSAGKATESAGDKVSKFDQKAEKTRKTLSDMVKEKYEVALEALDRVSPVLSVLKNGLQSIGNKAWNVTMKAVDLVTAPVRGIINLLKNPIFQVGAVLGVSIGFKDTVDTFVAFEETMSKVKALSNANNEEMEKLTETAKEMGAKTRYSGTESAEAFTYMAQAGWEVNDMIDGIGGVMSLAASDGLNLAATTDIVSNALTAFGLTAKDTAEFADILAVASSATNTDVAGLGEAFKYIAPVAGALGYSINDVSTALGLMSNNAVKGSMAGTTLKTALANMAAPTDKMAASMEQYGISLLDSNGNMKTLKEVMDNLRIGLRGLSADEQTAAASTIFGKDAMAGMLSIINTTEEDYRKLTEAINNSEGAADNMAATMQDNLAGTFESLGGAIETVQLTLGERLKPHLQSLAQWLEDKMPAIEEAISEAMDTIDAKIDMVKRKIDAFTSTTEWKNADLFGKIKIAWDELIGNPLSEWWNTTGVGVMQNIMQSIGNGLGTAIGSGIMFLLGINPTEGIEEGVSIGSSFAKGFAEGFDGAAVKEAIMSALSGILSSAAGVFSGDAGIGNWISALLVGKTALSLGGTLFKGAGLGKTLLTGASGGGGLLGLAGTTIGSAGLGTGLLGLGANTSMALGAGNIAGGASLSAGALSGLGLGAMAGGVMGGATLISGGMDLHKGFTSENEAEAAVYKNSGAKKIGGTLAGAATGAAIGSVVPVIGTAVGGLIGAGIGGLSSWLSAKKDVQEYEESVQAAMLEEIETARQLALQQEQAKYKTQELKDALVEVSEGNMTPEQFGVLTQKIIKADFAKHFGKITLSLKEVKAAAESIVFKNGTESLNKFLMATEQARSGYESFKNIVSDVERWNWKSVSLGQMNEGDMNSYISSVNNMVNQAKNYIEDQQYAVSISFDIFFDAETAQAYRDDTNKTYAGIQQRIDDISRELNEKMIIHLEDGIISLDEAAEITNLQNQIIEITGKVAQAQESAKIDALGIKFKGAALNLDTFTALQTELANYVNDGMVTADEALTLQLTNINLELAEGVISPLQYSTKRQQIEKEFNEYISGIQLKSENFQLNSIVEAYGSELEGILPELEGNISSRLSQALNNAMQDPSLEPLNWSINMEEAISILGLEGLDTETQMQIVALMANVAQTIPQKLNEELASTGIDFSLLGPVSAAYAEEISALLAETDLSPEIANAILTMDHTQIKAAIESLASDTGTAINTAYSTGFNTTTDVTIMANYKLANPSATLSFSGGGSGTATVTGVLADTPMAGASMAIGARANGGFTSGAELSWIGEDGPEVVIPLGDKRRGRGLSLWQQAGEILGISKYANGGFVGGSNGSNLGKSNTLINNFANLFKTPPSKEYDFTGNDTDKESSTGWTADLQQSNKATGSVSVNVNMTPTFNIEGGNVNEDNIVQILKSHIREMADDLGDEMAAKLEKIFSNMPA